MKEENWGFQDNEDTYGYIFGGIKVDRKFDDIDFFIDDIGDYVYQITDVACKAIVSTKTDEEVSGIIFHAFQTITNNLIRHIDSMEVEIEELKKLIKNHHHEVKEVVVKD